jgi:hypothetical protein
MCRHAENGSEEQTRSALVSVVWSWASVLVIAMSLFIALKTAVHAQQGGTSVEIEFNIPSQPLESALDAYSEASRLQILYETALTAGRRSAELKGKYPQETALRVLLSGTGLDFTFTEDRAFTLVPAKLQPPNESSRSIASYNQFLGGVQAGVMTALCRRSETRPSGFRLAFQFWISDSGAIRNPHLLSTTGLASRDAAVMDVLARVVFDRSPPAGMPQPVTMVLGARPYGRDDECAATAR